MISKIIIAGFGGQGIIVGGKLLAYAAMKESKEVTHFPAYGAEMRGGTCNCSIIVSDTSIANPIIDRPDIGVFLNKPSRDKYEKLIQDGGYIIVNKTLSSEPSQRELIKSSFVEASQIAESLGSLKSTNMVILGALSKITNVVKLDSLINSLKFVFPNFSDKLIDINIGALKAGFNAI